MPDPTIPAARYEVEPRAPHLGGGWRLRCLDASGNEVAGGVFPLDLELGDDADGQAYCDAMDEGQAWLASLLASTPQEEDA